MKLAVMQPYFLPYLGYFDLLNQVDEWIVFDTPQYEMYGWMNRNRVLKPGPGWQYIMAPLRHDSIHGPINRVVIGGREDWRALILRQLEHYKREAPFYRETVQLLRESFAGLGSNLAEVNTELIRRVADRLGITTPLHVYSRMDLRPAGPVNTPGDWAWTIAAAYGADEYVNRPGGAAFIDERPFRERGIKLIFQTFESMTYACGSRAFIPDLSIVDVLMWNAPEAVKRYLDAWRTERAGAEGTTE